MYSHASGLGRISSEYPLSLSLTRVLSTVREESSSKVRSHSWHELPSCTPNIPVMMLRWLRRRISRLQERELAGQWLHIEWNSRNPLSERNWVVLEFAFWNRMQLGCFLSLRCEVLAQHGTINHSRRSERCLKRSGCAFSSIERVLMPRIVAHFRGCVLAGWALYQLSDELALVLHTSGHTAASVVLFNGCVV